MLLFLLPARFVAYETVEMVNTVVLTLLVLAAVLLLLMVLAVAAVLRHRSSARMVLQEQANLRRQEELNERLEESNAMLARSKEAAEQALQIAEAANKAKSAFLGNVSYDIRTPMNAIIGFTTLLTNEVDDPVAQEYAGLNFCVCGQICGQNASRIGSVAFHTGRSRRRFSFQVGCIVPLNVGKGQAVSQKMKGQNLRR